MSNDEDLTWKELGLALLALLIVGLAAYGAIKLVEVVTR
jgi:hypothetical protein